MSWSVNLIGRAEAVALDLEKESTLLAGQSKLEYDAALPHLAALVRQNFNDPIRYPYPALLIHLEASGGGVAHRDGKLPFDDSMVQVQRSCVVKIETFYSKLV